MTYRIVQTADDCFRVEILSHYRWLFLKWKRWTRLYRLDNVPATYTTKEYAILMAEKFIEDESKYPKYIYPTKQEL